MKKNLMVTYMVAALLMVFTRCSENEVVTPDQQIQASEATADRESDAGRKNKKSKYIGTPVTGTIDGSTFGAEYRIIQFVEENDVLYAVGYLENITGDNLPSQVAALPNQVIKMPVDTGDAARNSSGGRTALACDVLLLDLGPLDLDLLGLTIHLDQVVLEIVAETGAGNLLGNLLCAVVSLLDGVAVLGAIADLLNQIIAIIGVLP